jgi:hypothetical protein
MKLLVAFRDFSNAPYNSTQNPKYPVTVKWKARPIIGALLVKLRWIGFRHVRIIAKGDYQLHHVCQSVHPHGTVQFVQYIFSWNLILGDFSKISREKPRLTEICFFPWRPTHINDNIYLYIFSGSAAQSGLWPPRSRGFLITHNDAPQSVGLLWTSDQLVAEISSSSSSVWCRRLPTECTAAFRDLLY